MEFFNEVLNSAGGTTVIILGLAGVLAKITIGRILSRHTANQDSKLKTIQAKLDSTNKRIQTELDKNFHIHRVQFEKEFQIYEEIWKKLVELNGAAMSLRPELDFIDPKEDEAKRKAKRLERFGNAISQFIESAHKNRPFYSEDVYKSLEQIWKLAHTEAVEYQHFSGKENFYWDKALKNQAEIITQIENCCEKIRKRIGSVKVTN